MRKKISRFVAALSALAAIVAATPKHALAQGSCYDTIMYDGFTCPNIGFMGDCRYCYFDCRAFIMPDGIIGPINQCPE
jgi:hypothetical protein